MYASAWICTKKVHISDSPIIVSKKKTSAAAAALEELKI
jgi:hypothetical protein